MDVNAQGFLNTALAYFQNLPQKKRYEISQLFRVADTNGDGTISFEEFQQLFEDATSSSSSHDDVKIFLGRFFKEFVDTDGDGRWDYYDEFIAYFYLIKSGRMELLCKGCHGLMEYVMGMDVNPISSRVDCTLFALIALTIQTLKKVSISVRISCYRDGKYTHQHEHFLDSFVLLCSKFVHKSTAPTTVTQNLQIDQKMQEIRSTAFAYYDNMPLEYKQKANEICREMDSDGDGAITLQQYEKKFGSSTRMKKCFDEVDINGDGRLDFSEFITIYYLDKGGRLRVWCNGHGCIQAPFLKGAYFVCVNCFASNREESPFYLCTFCYRNGKYTHRHTNFVDNCMLLQDKMAPYRPDQGQAVVQNQPAAQNYQGTLVVAKQSASLLGILGNIASVGSFITAASGGCNIL